MRSVSSFSVKSDDDGSLERDGKKLMVDMTVAKDIELSFCNRPIQPTRSSVSTRDSPGYQRPSIQVAPRHGEEDSGITLRRFFFGYPRDFREATAVSHVVADLEGLHHSGPQQGQIKLRLITTNDSPKC